MRHAVEAHHSSVFKTVGDSGKILVLPVASPVLCGANPPSAALQSMTGSGGGGIEAFLAALFPSAFPVESQA